MQWPINREVYPDTAFLKMIQRSIADVANTISQFEPVVMLMDAEYENSARKQLTGSVEIWNIPTDDLWCRDSGPFFVQDEAGQQAISHLNFNGWGNKQVHENDGLIAKRVAERLEIPLLDNGLTGEAGGIEFDGQGTLIAHESSWVNTNRNAGSKAEIEQLLLNATGGEKVIWAPGLIGEDITDYHIDALARFTEPGKILIQLADKIDMEDPWSIAAFETYKILKSTMDASGKPLEITTVPEPGSTRVNAADFVASYVNYYICNGAVIAAHYGDRDRDDEVRTAFTALFPDREVVMLNIDVLGELGGGIHCATQQQPAFLVQETKLVPQLT